MEVNTIVKLDDHLGEDLKEGIDLVANAVKSTLGPKGRTVIISEGYKPHITKDGVTVAKAINPSDTKLKVGVELMKEAADNLVKKVGDGTTSVCVLTQALIEEGFKRINKFKKNPILLKRELEEDLEKALKKLNEIKKPCTRNILKHVATISANNDVELGTIISDTINDIGEDGMIVVEESKNIETTVKTVNGMEIERGYIAPHFITDTSRNEIVMDKPYIMISNQKLMRITDVLPLLEEAAKQRKPILLIAEEFEPEVIENLKYNKMQGTVLAVPIIAPSFGDYRKQLLEDLAILTGGQYLDYEDSRTLVDYSFSMLGKCDKIIIDKDHTIVMGGAGKKEKIDERVEQIRDLLNRALASEEDTKFMKEFHRKRLAKLLGGVSTLYVGGTTEMEMKERKDRADDAIAATQAAREGVVLGGGLSYLMLSEALESNSMLGSVLDKVCATILFNNGFDNHRISETIKYMKMSDYYWIFNADTEQYEEASKTCIFDPAPVIENVLKTAVSITTLYLTTKCIIYEEPLPVVIR